MEEKEPLKADAQTSIEVLCDCPNPQCDAEFLDVLEEVRESMDEYHCAHNCNIEITCSECNEVFIVENIHF